MKKLTAALVALISCLGHLKAQTPTEKTLLWEVSGKGIGKPSYLFGTIHIMCQDEMRMPTVVKDRFNSTQTLFLEIDMDDPAMMKEMLSGVKMKDSASLETLLGKRYDSVSTAFQKVTGMPLQLMSSMKPFLLMSFLYPSILNCTPVSWEAEFQKLATAKGAEIKGLETLQEQMDVFEKIPYKVQAETFAKMVLNIDSAKNDFDQMMKLYNQKDINKLYESSTAEEDFGKYEGILLNERNRNWIPVIGEQAKKQPTFFAFGAGHLGGDKGVITLLRKSGFTVKPIMY